MGWKEFAGACFSFGRRDIIGITVMLLITVLLFFSPSFFGSQKALPVNAQDTAWMTAITAMGKNDSLADEPEYFRTYTPDLRKTASTLSRELFYFDPNTLESEGWKRLGLRDKTIHTIQNFLSKGGHFYKPADLSKVYGLRPEELEKLLPYVRIEQRESISPVYQKTEKRNTSKTTIAVDINSADTTAWIGLPGIGSKLATRIVSFREKLGGFYSIEQVGETYGLADSTFQKIRQYLLLENVTVKKININKASVDELKAHPYIKYTIANALIAYRNNHGPFLKMEDLKKVMVVTDEIYNRIVPYLSVEE